MAEIRGGRIQAVIFDVGEVILDETTEWGAWADWLGVPRHTFSAVFGAVIARGGKHHEVFQHFRPGFDITAERERRLEVGMGEYFDGRDLYPDVRDCLSTLKRQGFRVGLAGNQTSRSRQLLPELHLDTDFILTPDDLEAEKPSVAFFEKLLQRVGVEPAQALYVGDRLDNDLLPAREAGLATAWLRRGPWAYICSDNWDVESVDLRLQSLAELPDLLESLVHQDR